MYHSAWRELCEGMIAAGSLDEVIEVHEAYLLSIHRQCFVAPDKLVGSPYIVIFVIFKRSCLLFEGWKVLKNYVWLLLDDLIDFQWALIASRINSILGLALDFYSVQQTLSSGGAVSAIKARCEMEVDRIEKQFDDCVAFLLRVVSNPSWFH